MVEHQFCSVSVSLIIVYDLMDMTHPWCTKTMGINGKMEKEQEMKENISSF